MPSVIMNGETPASATPAPLAMPMSMPAPTPASIPTAMTQHDRIGKRHVHGRHGRGADHRGDREDRADRQVEAACQQREHLAHGHHREIARLPQHVLDVLGPIEPARQQREDDDGDQQQERQHAQPHEQLLADAMTETAAASNAPPAACSSVHHAASRSKKWLSTRSSVISLPASSARSSPRYMT